MIENIVKTEAGNLNTPVTFILGNREFFESEGDDVQVFPVVYMDENVGSILSRSQNGGVHAAYNVFLLVLTQGDIDNKDTEQHLPNVEAMEQLAIELFGNLNNRREFRQNGLTNWQMERLYHIFNQDLVGVSCSFSARILDVGHVC